MKYLLVLDDVWNENPEKWRGLCRFLTLDQEGSRVVVTTRSEMTAKIIGDKHVYKLQGLSPKNLWLLFESASFDKEEQACINHPDLVDIGKKIVEKCYNIPLAIKVVGSLLFGPFEHSGFVGTRKGDNEIISMLKLSYHNLSFSLKNCFNYCALFPKDYRLERKELISLWTAQGYIVSLDRDQSIEDAAEEHFLILVRRCFFQDVEKDKHGDIGSVKIHDLMHDAALDVGREELGIVSSNTTKLGDKVRHVYFADGNFSQSYLFKSKIRSFILRYDRSITLGDAHIDSLMCLRVLCLKSVGIKKLPDSIGKLLHLRYLELNIRYLDSLKGWWREEELGEDDNDDDHILRSSFAFPCLSYLIILKCPKLTSFPSCPSLESLDLNDMGLLKSMHSSQFLNYLHIKSNEKVEGLSELQDVFRKYTSSLRSLRISNCRNLQKLGRGGLEHLTALESLVLDRNHQLSISLPLNHFLNQPHAIILIAD